MTVFWFVMIFLVGFVTHGSWVTLIPMAGFGYQILKESDLLP